MPTVNIDIAPSIIDWIFNHIREDKLNTSIRDTLNKWKAGEKKPTFNQLETLSKQINIPFGYFFLQEPPDEDNKILEYRTVDSVELQNPSRELIDTITNMENVQEWMRNNQIMQGYSPLGIVGSMKNIQSSQSIAARIREDMGLQLDWYHTMEDSHNSFKYLRSIMEDLGIIIMLNGVVGQNTRRPLNIEEFRAFTLLDEYAPLIFINSNDSSNGKSFSLLHEAAHIWLGSNDFYNDRYGNTSHVTNLEKTCNSVAAEILVPNNLFAIEWNKSNHINISEKIDKLSKVFKCGMTVIARKALDNAYIDISTYEKVAHDAIEKYKQLQSTKKGGGGNFYNNIAFKNDRRLILALNSSIYEGTTQFTDAYRITNTTRKTFSKLVDKVQGIAYDN